MLPLDSKSWKTLQNAYGIDPDLPRKLDTLYENAENPTAIKLAWASGDFWSSLCHQGTVYVATYAAVPHIVEVLRKTQCLANRSIRKTRASMLCFVGSCAASAKLPSAERIPKSLRRDWELALKNAKLLIADLMKNNFDEALTRHLLAAMASVSGYSGLYHIIDDLDCTFSCPECGASIDPMNSDLNLEFSLQESN